jgi:1,4-dihydroxy-2-naphthoate octaprenyltransferase
MISKSTLLHLRIPFSLFLMPVFFFAAAQYPFADPIRVVLVFLIIHIFLYPASNGYNSWFDKDTGSIGGLEKPPAVNRDLYYVALLFDAIAVIAGLFIGWFFALMMLIYGLVSKAYSHPAVRLKKYPVISLVTAAVFQGAFTYLMVYQAIHGSEVRELVNPKVLFPAALSSAMLFGFYPLTQVYQHEEDGRRGDVTFSLMLGVRGTFLFALGVFVLACVGYFIYFNLYFSPLYFLFYLVCLLPVLSFFIVWMRRIWRDEQEANFSSVMRLNALASFCLILFFLIFAGLQSHFSA